MAHWAKPGVKCVCIHDRGRWAGPDGESPSTPPLKGKVYTIVETDQAEGTLFLTLAECSQDEMYSVKNFRPVISRTQEQDLELFLPLIETLGEPA